MTATFVNEPPKAEKIYSLLVELMARQAGEEWEVIFQEENK